MEYETIQDCKQKVLSGEILSLKETEDLFNISEKSLKILAQAANEVTRKFNGMKIYVEKLNNIKKNGCSEDCVFFTQSAFYDTKI